MSPNAKKLKKALKRAKEGCGELAELLPILVFETDLKGNLTFKNNTANTLFGAGSEELPNVNLFDYIAPEDKARCLANVERVLAGEVLQGSEYTAVRRNGEKFPVLAHSTVIKDTHGRVSGMRGTLIEISERKKLEKDLRESMQKYQLLVDNLYDFVTEVDHNGKYVFVNPAFCSLVGK